MLFLSRAGLRLLFRLVPLLRIISILVLSRAWFNILIMGLSFIPIVCTSSFLNCGSPFI